MVDSQNPACIRSSFTWGMVPGWVDTIWSIDVVAPGLFSKVFLIDLIEYLPLVLHGLFCYFPNMQATQGGIFLILLIFLGIIPLLDILMMDSKEQWFSLWFQTRSSLSSRTIRSTFDHILATSSLVSLAPISYFSTSSRLVGI